MIIEETLLRKNFKFFLQIKQDLETNIVSKEKEEK